MRPLQTGEIARQIADAACKRICNRTILCCQQIEPILLGDDTPLANAWEDICVQEHQGDRSVLWDDSYGAMLLAIIEGEIAKLDEPTWSAIWHQTDDGFDWDDDEDKPPEGIFNEDLARYILNQYVLPAAVSYSNARIRKYIDRAE